MNSHELDARHLLCPMPVIRTQNRIAELANGDRLVVYATDPGVLYDLPAWCRVHGHQVEAVGDRDGDICIEIRVCRG